MNKIKELSDKAKANVPYGIFGVERWIEAYNEKFAEVLIAECFEFLDDETEMKIKKHLGLENELQTILLGKIKATVYAILDFTLERCDSE